MMHLPPEPAFEFELIRLLERRGGGQNQVTLALSRLASPLQYI